MCPLNAFPFGKSRLKVKRAEPERQAEIELKVNCIEIIRRRREQQQRRRHASEKMQR